MTAQNCEDFMMNLISVTRHGANAMGLELVTLSLGTVRV